MDKTKKSGEELIANISRRINGSFGIDAKQADATITYATSLLDIVSLQELSSRDLVTQSEILIKDFKALSKATGMSVENLIEINRIINSKEEITNQYNVFSQEFKKRMLEKYQKEMLLTSFLL